jgi:hypothetical protein
LEGQKSEGNSRGNALMVDAEILKFWKRAKAATRKYRSAEKLPPGQLPRGHFVLRSGVSA